MNTFKTLLLTTVIASLTSATAQSEPNDDVLTYQTISQSYIPAGPSEAPTTVEPRVVYFSGAAQGSELYLAFRRQGYHLLGGSGFVCLDWSLRQKQVMNFGKTIGAQVVMHWIEPLGAGNALVLAGFTQQGKAISWLAPPAPPGTKRRIMHYIGFLAR